MIPQTLDALLQQQRLLEARIRFATLIGLTPPMPAHPKRPHNALTPSTPAPSKPSESRRATVCNSARLSV